MKVFFSDQSKHFKKHLEYFKSKSVMLYDRTRLPQKTTSVELNTDKALQELDLAFLFNYHIFPSRIMGYQTQWEDENREMRAGDTIVQQAYVPPLGVLSMKLIFAVRIHEIINESNKRGFSYETLEGHAEKGISTFTVESQDGKLIFKIQTCSITGNLLSTIAGPVFSVPYQAYCTRQALECVKRQVEKQDYH